MTESDAAAGDAGRAGAAAFVGLLRLYRRRALLTQEDLARRSGVSVRTIRKLESGSSRPRYSSVRLLAGALDLSEREYEAMTGVFGGLDSGCPGHDAEPAYVFPAQLPAGPISFVARSDELACLDAILRSGPAGAIANVSGAAGVGKTAIALHWAHRSDDQFPDGQLYADLQGCGSPESRPADTALVLARFIRGLNGDAQAIPDDLDERSALYRSLLHDRRVLIVLDDAASERQVRPLLPAVPGCKVLVTSRIRLAALEGAQVVDLHALEPAQALELLRNAAGPERVAAESAAAAQIVEICGYLPLAVQIAAARLVAHPHWSLGLLARRLSDEHRRLDELAIGDLEVRRSFASTYRQLEPLQRALFRRLGLLPGTDFADWAAMSLVDVPAGTAASLTESLADMRLLEAAGIDACGSARYRIPGLLRVFARERAAAEDDEQDLNASLARLQGMRLQSAELAEA